MLSSHSSFVFYKVYRKFGRKPESNQNTSKKNNLYSPDVPRRRSRSQESREGAGLRAGGRALEPLPVVKLAPLTNDTTKSTPVARRLANGRRRWSCAAKLRLSGGGRGRGVKLAFPLEKLRCLVAWAVSVPVSASVLVAMFPSEAGARPRTCETSASERRKWVEVGAGTRPELGFSLTRATSVITPGPPLARF